jgi:hypothetical protein
LGSERAAMLPVEKRQVFLQRIGAQLKLKWRIHA